MYSGPNGLCCAAAPFLIKNKLDSDFYEKRNSDHWNKIIEDGYAFSAYSNLIRRLQGIHDNRQTSEWPKDLRELYADYELSVEKLNKLIDTHTK